MSSLQQTTPSGCRHDKIKTVLQTIKCLGNKSRKSDHAAVVGGAAEEVGSVGGAEVVVGAPEVIGAVGSACASAASASFRTSADSPVLAESASACSALGEVGDEPLSESSESL